MKVPPRRLEPSGGVDELIEEFDMTDRTCTVPDCGRPTRARGWCSTHYQRWRATGDPLGSKSRVTDWPDGTRTCTVCLERLPIGSFALDAGATGGRRSQCNACRSERMKTWYASNRDRQVQRARNRYGRDHEKILARDRARYRSDREKRLELVYAGVDRRRAARFGVEFDPTVTRTALRTKLGTRCHYCSQEMDFEILDGHVYSPTKATIEHMIPLARKGPHSWDNCVLACWGCNSEKHLRTPEEWMEVLDDADGDHDAQDLHVAVGAP